MKAIFIKVTDTDMKKIEKMIYYIPVKTFITKRNEVLLLKKSIARIALTMLN